MGVPNRQIGEPSSTENTLLHNILKQIHRLTEVISTSGGGGGGGITSLTGDVTGAGTGAVATTIKSSVALTGNPTAPTQSVSDNSTRIATTSFVSTALLSVSPVGSKLYLYNNFK